MKKYFFLVTFFIWFTCLGQCNEYPVFFNNFIKCLSIDTEAGFVFFGSKPICYYKVGDKNSLLIGTPSHELEVKLRMGIKWWLHAKPLQKNDDFVLKISTLKDGYEILCLNKKEVLETIQNNLSLFRYALGQKVTPQTLFEKLSKDSRPFYDILNHNTTLVGILLGFGTSNSIIGGRHENILDIFYTKPIPPHALIPFKDLNDAWDYLILSAIFACQKKHSHPFEISFAFQSHDEELDYFKNLSRKNSANLYQYNPKLIYGNYDSDEQCQLLIKKYEQEQRELQSIIYSEDLTEKFLKKIGIVFSNLDPVAPTRIPHAEELANLLKNILIKRHFKSLEGALEGILDASLQQPDKYSNPNLDEFYKFWLLEKYQNKEKIIEDYFAELSNDSSFISINPFIFYKKLTQGQGDFLTRKNSIGIFTLAVYPADSNTPFPYNSLEKTQIDLSQTIEGLSQGVQGMQEGEIREIHIHPQAGYGFFTEFEVWQPLKIVVRLESIKIDSPELALSSNSLLQIDRPIKLSCEEINSLEEMHKNLAYHEAKMFWNFYRNLRDIVSAQQVIDQMKLIWNEPQKRVDLTNIDHYNLRIWNKLHANESNKAIHLFSKLKSETIIKDKLLIHLTNIGEKKIAYPKKISLIMKDLDENIIQQLSYENLDPNEFLLWNKGLQLGLQNRHEEDRGTLFIHPELSDRSLFHNRLVNKGLIVDFEIFKSD